MSDSLIAFHPAIEEPSNIRPSAKASSLTWEASKLTCCILPRGSVKRRSTYLTSLSVMSFSTDSASFGLVIAVQGPLIVGCWIVGERRSQGIVTGLAGADADRRIDARDEDLAVADPPGARRVLDRLDRLVGELVGEHDLDLHLGQKVDDIFSAAIKLGMALLPPEALRFGDGDALETHLLKGLLDLVELERLDDGFDLLHCAPFFGFQGRVCRPCAIMDYQASSMA